MKLSEQINSIFFDFADHSQEEIERISKSFPNKMLRWLGSNHPDNRTRKIFFRLTNVTIGEDTIINQNFIVSDGYHPLLTIGNRVAISPNVTVICQSDPNYSDLQKHPYVKEVLMVNKPVVIGDDVWIGTNAVILPGVTIGKHSIIAAGSVVSRDVPDNSIYGGVPAKLMRKL
jgi:acetyltransferase-like isoleucine patch superfamily enzyme